MAEYGIPYKGSKGSICNDLIRIFPKADHFYDLFGGGFSVTHAMLERRSKDYKHFHFNEIRPVICDLLKRAIAGEFNYKKFQPPWVSREEFFKKIDTNLMIRMLWSFGNAGSEYLFSKEIEPYKRSMHNAIVFNKFDELAKLTLGMSKFREGYSVKDRRLILRNRIAFFRKTKVPEFLWPFLKEKDLAVVKAGAKAAQLQRLQQLQQLQHLQQLQQLQQLERLERLQQLQQLERLEQLQRLEMYSMSYDKVKLKPKSVIYCDPPYKGTASYDGEFDHSRFLNWCDKQSSPVFISEYDIPDNRFTLIKTMGKRSMLSSSSRKLKIEKVYANRAAMKAL